LEGEGGGMGGRWVDGSRNRRVWGKFVSLKTEEKVSWCEGGSGCDDPTKSFALALIGTFAFI
jgi:hypothetical protein